jgi:hypothetical protein
MTHVVYLVFKLLASGVPELEGTERSQEDCNAVVQLMASAQHGKNATSWYCQPAVTKGGPDK